VVRIRAVSPGNCAYRDNRCRFQSIIYGGLGIAIGIAPVMQIGIAFLKIQARALDANQCRFTAMRDLRASLR
jgi:hypothetical protein